MLYLSAQAVCVSPTFPLVFWLIDQNLGGLHKINIIHKLLDALKWNGDQNKVWTSWNNNTLPTQQSAWISSHKYKSSENDDVCSTLAGKYSESAFGVAHGFWTNVNCVVEFIIDVGPRLEGKKGTSFENSSYVYYVALHGQYRVRKIGMRCS
jgi:hypothetical protein